MKHQDDRQGNDILQGNMIDSEMDFLRNSIIVLISLMPGAGGALSIMLDKYFPEKSRERLVRFVNELSCEIKNIDQEKIDYAYMQSEEFEYIVGDIFDKVGKCYQREKISAYKNIFLNTIENKKCSQDIKEVYLKIIEDLSQLEIIILKAAFDAGDEYDDAPDTGKNHDEFSIKETLFVSSIPKPENMDYNMDYNDVDWNIDADMAVDRLISMNLLKEKVDFVAIRPQRGELANNVREGRVVFRIVIKDYLTSLAYGLVEFITRDTNDSI